MKTFLKCFTLGMFLAYLVGSFIAGSFNLVEWDVGAKIALVSFVVFISFVVAVEKEL